jgi:NAD(P)-dependent dehydrogenase (short-subunit alcohol dehydrogenase family)
VPARPGGPALTDLPAPDTTRLAPATGARIAVVGACGGTGRPLVRACLASGVRVAALDLAASHDRHPPPPGVLSLRLDATHEAEVTRAFAAMEAEWRGLDGLVFLVGYTIVPPRSLDEVTAAQFDDIIAGNLRSAFLVTRAALPLLRQAGGGAIVTIASGLALTGFRGYGPYAAAKAGLVALTKVLALENAPAIRANVVAPGAMPTAFLAGGTGRGGDDAPPAAVDPARYVPTIPLGRMAVPDDVVGAILFLLSDASRFITGQTLHVNGGRVMP